MGSHIFPYIQKCLETLPDQFKIPSSTPVYPLHFKYGIVYIYKWRSIKWQGGCDIDPTWLMVLY